MFAGLMSRGSYAEATAWRAQSFVKHLPQTVGFAIIVLGVFLLGAWFIRSGVMADPAAHLKLFRWMAWIGIPLGLGLSLIAARISLTHVPGQNDGPFQLAMGLAFVGNLPACVGYLAAVVLLQAGQGGGLASLGGGTTDLVVGGRQAANLLTKMSWICGGTFLFLSLLLSMVSPTRSGATSEVLEQLQNQPAPAAPAPIPLEGATPTTPPSNDAAGQGSQAPAPQPSKPAP